MRAMILAAGLGTRMGPLCQLCAKPALPVLGRPLIAWLLEWLAHHGVEEVGINLHHLPRTVEDAVDRFAPRGLSIVYSHETERLGTGGGIAVMRDFLAASDPAIVVAGDMVLDCDLSGLVSRHRQAGSAATLLMQSPSAENAHFGTLGIDSDGSLRRIAERFDLGGEVESGVFVGLRLLSPSLFDTLPDRPPGSAFEDLSDWWAPLLADGRSDIRGQFAEPGTLVWQSVGTPAEYLAANLAPPALSFMDEATRAAPGTRTLARENVVLGAGAELAPGARLRRCVVWEGERVPADFVGEDGVFARGRFYPCR